MSREPPSLMDLAVIAISPALIMALVGSLTFFLADVFYVGDYQSRLNYTLFFFVAGAVLVSRISIELGHGRAAGYGLILGVVTFIALETFLKVDAGGPLGPVAPLVNLFLMAFIWWSAHKLTWDCTHIDERRESSGRGLLSAAGLEQGTDAKSVKRAASRPDPDVIEDVAVVGESDAGLLKRWARFRERQRTRPHTPGLWVIYFSMAALPVFGLGQSLIPADDPDRRSYSFRLMFVYVGSGMGLLLTTSFLGLRRYLRQRNTPMPAKMTAGWLALGGAMIAAFLVVAALLPRPYSETPIVGGGFARSEKRDASEHARMGDSAGEGEGRPGEQSRPGDGEATADGGEPGGRGDGQGERGSGERRGERGDGDNDRGGESGRGEPGNADGQRDEKGEGGRRADRAADGDAGGSRDGGSSGASSPTSGLSRAFESVAALLKWVVFGLLALVVIAFVFRNGLAWLANFMPWARGLLDALERLFARGGPAAGTETDDADEGERLVPFSAFSNPFHDGTAGRRSPEELLRYTFAALEAWSRERGHPRRPDETALEFTRRVGEEFPVLDEEARRLGGLYARVAYAGRNAPAKTAAIVERFWARLAG